MTGPIVREGVAHAPSRAVRALILGVIGFLFVIPFVAMVEFTLRKGLAGGHDFSRWSALFQGGLTGPYRQVLVAVGNSVGLAVGTVLIVLLLLVPTMLLVHIRFPRLRRLLEFVCILPISIPAIVLVVGLAPVYSVLSRLAGSGVWTLSLAYGIIVLPYAYRAIQANLDAVDVRTLSEAARTLGAGWGSVLFRVLLPNLRRGLLAGAFIAVAVVLGEFTIASLLSRVNLQTALVVVSKADPYTAVILSLLSLILAFLLLLLIGRLGAERTRSPRHRPIGGRQ
ncbi:MULTISPECIES: ABC transporter permease [unclassified Cryobacterium]|uniref:ABC transporter permease n=1 Tax=unclassified Cryobacterium TaxID=2649013 RepID=UPI001F546043|nr:MULTISPECIES: ABC transporter permease subunit [unclassified Cryobacterium]MEB0287093.1 ABC transporter permease subunit [Cryobacterium sp. 10S3]MDY7528678.1 ABC transporter permease subunit [Cryobacterium sp. 10C2]MDY7555579.1 ABC transporter permease subunit [Cryobacterium sp. 10C3]MEB0001872.1 ABC transporter permease subunit [Cryobacterium sp. RTC2.1]MEB0202926.1 ABC transporter permease subunit [Cryobacterium sp. 5I3]